MSLDPREIYQDIILDHYKRPRNHGVLDAFNCEAAGHNPMCGDEVHLTVKVVDGRIEEIACDGQGCAISQASASMMTEMVKGKTVTEAEALFEQFRSILTSTGDIPEDADLGDLEALFGVRELPVRIKCAILAWHALHEALKKETAS